MLKRTVLMLMLLSAVCLTLTAAEKYAILIAGDYTAANVPADKKWNDGLGNNTEFWNDLYLQWEMLYQKGYKKENIKVLFAHGTDLWNVDNYDYIDTRYRAEHITYDPTERIVNYPITTTGLDNAISGLTITSNDFLYVWAMSHGGSSTQSSIGFIGTGTQPLFYEMTPSEFAGKINVIPAFKKEIVLSLNYAQGFKNVFTGTNVRVELSSTNTKAHRADDKTKIDTYYPYLENELINGNIYYHGEFNFHKYCSLMGQTQYGSTTYPDDGTYPNPFDTDIRRTTDNNNDGQYSFAESYNWVVAHQSDLLNSTYTDFKDNGEVTPYYTFPMGYYSSLDYPTLVYNSFGTIASSTIANGPSNKGIVGIAEDLSISNSDFAVSLTLSENSIATILDDHSIGVGRGFIYLNPGSSLSGQNMNSVALYPNEGMSATTFFFKGATARNLNIDMFGYSEISVLTSSELDNVKLRFIESMAVPRISFQGSFRDASLTFKGNSEIMFDTGYITGNSSYNSYINITDGSILKIGAQGYIDYADLNVYDFGILNYSKDNGFYESGINVSNSGCLNFIANGTYTPTTAINAGAGGKVVVEENSILNLNSSVLNMAAGSIMTLKDGSSLKGSYSFPTSTKLSTNGDCSIEGIYTFSPNSRMSAGGVFGNLHPKTVIKSGSEITFNQANLYIAMGTEVTIENGAKITLNGPLKVVVGPGAKINHGGIIEAGDVEWIYGFEVFTPDPDKTVESWDGIAVNPGSKMIIRNSTFSGVLTAISGAPESITITGCTFTECTNGINLVNCNNFSIDNNIFTGTSAGVAVSLTGSNGNIKNNTIENFAHGVVLILSSPLMSKNVIRNNVMNGVYVTGNNAYPQLIDPLELKIVVNNEIAHNGINIYDERNAQIRMIYPSNAYMYNGLNNVYFDVQAPSIRTESNMIVNDQMKSLTSPRVYINAENNYWGSSIIDSLNYEDIFDLWNESPQVGYSVRYLPYAEKAFTDGLQTPALYSTLSTEGIFLAQAIKAEYDGKIDLAIKKYNHIIEKYPESDENYIALTRLTDIYAAQELPLDQLMAIYEENIVSGDESVNKKFYKEMKVAASIKGKKYDEAIVYAEALKVEAQTETEVLLADIDIAIANLMKNAGSKGGAFKADSKINDLIAQISDSDVKGGNSPLSMTGQVLPTGHTLYQNYPNPFNPVTQINFALAKNAQVKLSVYNISGQKVAELANGVMNAGNHAVDFDGSKLNSGVYYNTLEADGITFTKKMLLTK